ncbi:MAG: hypothetical protein P8R42_05205 [Candidatus Binatia bacterium]|nr:hypothetical protein [Candidatus Binatia bacterium]
MDPSAFCGRVLGSEERTTDVRTIPVAVLKRATSPTPRSGLMCTIGARQK